MSGRIANTVPYGSLIKAPKPEQPKRKGIKARSDKRAAQERQYRAEADEFLSERPWCEMRLEGCTRRSAEVHHKKGRDGDRLLDQLHWMPACRSCHHATTVHGGVDPYAAGVSEHRHTTPERTWRVEWTGARPLTTNKVMSLHRMAWAKHTAEMRKTWGWLAKAARVQPCGAVELVVTPLHANHGSPQDVASCAPEAKAAIDGLVDAGLIPDDGPAHLLAVTFLPPLICGENGLRIDVREVRR